jgi:hypothetical protein
VAEKIWSAVESNPVGSVARIRRDPPAPSDRLRGFRNRAV